MRCDDESERTIGKGKGKQSLVLELAIRETQKEAKTFLRS